MSFGILSLILWLLPILGLPVAIVGIVKGIKGVRKNEQYATGGLICSIIGLSFAVANGVLGFYMGVTGQMF